MSANALRNKWNHEVPTWPCFDDDSALRSVFRPASDPNNQRTKNTHTTLHTNQCQKSTPDSQSQLSVFAFSFIFFHSVLLASASLFCMLQNPPLLPSFVLFSVLLKSSSFLFFCFFYLLNIFLGFLTLFFVSLGFDHLVLLNSFTEVNLLSGKFFSFSVIFQHLLWSEPYCDHHLFFL